MNIKIDGIDVMANSEWASVAYSVARKIIASKYRNRAFLAEHLYQDIIKKVGEPFDARTMGQVIRALHGDKLIHHYGVAAAKSSNYSLKRLWRKEGRWGRK